MLRLYLTSLLSLTVLAQFQTFIPRGHNDLVFSIHIPESTANSSLGPIYFQLNATNRVQWFALGEGEQMAGANIFVVYDAGKDVTVSPRSGVGHIQPLYNAAAQVTVLNGSGLHNGIMTANIKCDSCINWAGGSEKPTNSLSSWIWAVKYGKPMRSKSQSAPIILHDDFGVVAVDLTKATGPTSPDPFLDLAPSSLFRTAKTFDSEGLHRMRVAHGVLMSVAFLIFFPCSALTLLVFSNSHIVAIHGILQILTLAVSLVGMGLGIAMAKKIRQMAHYHIVIGFVVLGGLTLLQPAMGLLQHRHFSKTGGKGPFAYSHRWFGRIMILVGVVNVGLGFQFTGVGEPDAPRSVVIATSVIAGVVFIVYILTIGRYLHRSTLHKKPAIHITYDEGVQIIRAFLYYASKHPVEDLQAYTRQWVPNPHWVRSELVTIPDNFLPVSADAISKQLGPKGLVRVGGEKWWQWRGPAEELKGEWVEMRSHYNETEEFGGHCNRIMLYVHGGAYFFGSVDTHRYMLQRHARKLRGRVFAPNYRLAPQYPFPCGLQDCLAAYLWLLKTYDPKEIIIAGDSAGGGMALSLLVIMRDQGIPLPAGAILISPWVDLTHSFPSIVADNPGDYIPPWGFRHKPSIAWPPPNADELLEIKKLSRKRNVTMEDVEKIIPSPGSSAEEEAVRGFTVHKEVPPPNEHAYPGEQQNPDPASLHVEPDNLKVEIDGKTVELKDQIQMYATNQLMSHPLVSPVLQPSLGGLPPLQILSGGGEMLRDEQFYVAHKAANPTAYPPGDKYLDEYDPDRKILNKWEPTYVQLQVWDNLCHVAPTLSFTRPAKYMFRSISQFGSWALSRAQNVEVDIMDQDLDSDSSDDESDEPSSSITRSISNTKSRNSAISTVGRAGDPLPAFHQHMIRERIDKRGNVYPLDPQSSYPVLDIPPANVGSLNPVLIQRWLHAKHEWDVKFSRQKLRVQAKRLKEMAHGFQDFDGDCPPSSSLAARRAAPGVLPRRHTKKNYGLTLWSGWGSKHDKNSMKREHEAHELGRSTTRASVDIGQAGLWSSEPTKTVHQSNGEQQKTAYLSSGSETKASDEEYVPSAWGSTLNDALEKVDAPMLILPEMENLKPTNENSSTKALFHASGTFPVKSEASSSYLRGRPSSVGDRSELMSDTGDEASTIGGDKYYEMVPNIATDAASTRAVLRAKGVINSIEKSHLSTDTASTHGTSDGNALSAGFTT
ncbi:Alpha/beta hydrolase fold-3 [Penicillium taxi]|uniref:Alpha/beta hydrolase fold-3 n=1 Tax=Penicillium taxi TaxID=168475 RepID=UPI0025459FE4|nr:Alpha/beta hydrolase fold-3 [Penicillium taxi]KAJ5907367.1 Alpha/beta hydrolase fold-3 [Penicillium taxi]